jgi:ferritin-like metal-binding protein YciE
MLEQTARSAFVLGLRNAHAMEHRSRELMKWQSERLRDYPELRAKIAEHLIETEKQLERLEQCLHEFEQRPSRLKDLALSLLGNLTATSNALFEDEILHDLFTNCAFEHYEVAAYTSLVKMAEETGFVHAKALLAESWREERAMAEWIDSRIGKVTSEYLAKADEFQQRIAAGS